jgi:chromosome segregation ATPase
MHQIRSNETAVRAELTIIQTQERSQRAEMNQLRTKLNDAEQRATQSTRQLDRMKKEFASSQIKRDPIRAKKDEIGNRSGTPDQLQQQMSKELNEMRARFQILEKELQSTQIELKTKQQAYTRLEQRLKNMEAVSRAKDSTAIENEIKVVLYILIHADHFKIK